MAEEISKNITARLFVTLSSQEVSKVVSTDNILNNWTTIAKDLSRETPCSWVKWVAKSTPRIIFYNGFLIVLSLCDSIYYVADLRDVHKCERFNSNEESTQLFLALLDSAFGVEIRIIPIQQTSSTQVIVSEGLLEISIDAAVNPFKSIDNELPRNISKNIRLKEKWITAIKDLREVTTPDSWIKWHLLMKLADKSRLKIDSAKGFLVIKYLRDLEYYAFNLYGNEQVENGSKINVDIDFKPDVPLTIDQVENWINSVSGGKERVIILRDQEEMTGNYLLNNNLSQANLESCPIKGGPTRSIISALVNSQVEGLLIGQFQPDLVCYVVDLSEVPKCGSFNPYGNEQMEGESKSESVESLDDFLIRVASDLDVPQQKHKELIDLWKSKLGTLTTQKKHIETLISDENGWNNIQLDQIVKSTIKKMLISSKDRKRKLESSDLSGTSKKHQKLDIDELMSNDASICPFPLPDAKKPGEFYDRLESLRIAKEFILEAATPLKKPEIQVEPEIQVIPPKLKLLGTSGMPGIGKTQLLLQIAAASKEYKEVNVTPIYVTFNGGFENTTTYKTLLTTSQPANAFGQLLLFLCSVPLEYSKDLTLRDSLAAIRRIYDMKDADDVLLILVDEIGHLGDATQDLLHGLMSAMDASRGKLIFIFAHIKASVFESEETESGREVVQLPLPPLEIDIWKKDEKLASAANSFPAVHQLLLSCSGHPRAIFDGIPEAIKKNQSLLTTPTPIAIDQARQTIIDKCKFNLQASLQPIIESWFSQNPPSNSDVQNWSNMGVLHTLRDTNPPVRFLFPLLLQSWAKENTIIHPIAYHLQQLYDADAVLGPEAEKNMEALMYHYEAVLLIACKESTFNLASYYNSEHFGISIRGVKTTQIGGRKVKHVPNFANTPHVFQYLQDGLIVVSDDRTEIGTEYLVPFHSTEGTLLVAFVQCKYVIKKENWTTIKGKLDASMKAVKDSKEFSNRKFEMFRVVYTTVDQKIIQQQTFEGGVYYTENDLFKHTNKLGILRMHTQKLGKTLEATYPILKRAKSEIDES